MKRGISLLMILLLICGTVAIPTAAVTDGTVDDGDMAAAEQGEGKPLPADIIETTDANVETFAENPTQISAEASTEAAVIDYPVITSIRNLKQGAEITWESYGDQQLYRVYYRKAKTKSELWDEKYRGGTWTKLATVRGNSYLHTSVPDGETGIYTVRSVDENGSFTSDFFAEGWENRFFAAPVILSAHFDVDGAHLRWNGHEFTNGEVYLVFRKTAGTSWSLIGQTGAGVYTDVTADPKTEYTYTVRIANADASLYLSGHNGGRSVSFDAYPLVTKIENLEIGARLTWQRYQNAAKYRVYYYTGRGWQRIAQVSSVSFTDTTVKNGENRLYTVRALNENNEFISDYNRDGWENRFFAAPAFQSVSNTVKGVKLTWKRDAGAEDYRVYRRTKSGWTCLIQTDETEYIDTSVDSGMQYTYTLRMVRRDRTAFMSDYRSGWNVTYVAAPVIKNVENTYEGAKLTWNTVKGAYAYRVYYWSGKRWVFLATKTAAEYLDDSVKHEEAREYTVRCVDQKGNFVSDYYRDGYINTYYAPPVINSLKENKNGVSVTWTRAKGAEDYCVYRRTQNGSWKRLVQTDKTEYTDTTAENHVKYYYTLRMITADGKRFMSGHNGGKSIARSAIPAFSSLSNGENGVVLRWNPIPGESYYNVYYRKSSGWTRLTSTRGSSYTDTSVRDGETRVYTIRCIDDNGDFSTDFDRAGWSQTYYAPPVITSVTYEDGYYTLSWADYPNFAAYRVYRKILPDGDWVKIADYCTDHIFTDSEAQVDRCCAYVLRGQDRNGNIISSYVSDVPFYRNGIYADGTLTENGATYRFVSGKPLTGYHRDGETDYYYQNGKRIEADWYPKDVDGQSMSTSAWLYELMCAVDAQPSVDADDAPAVFALAKQRGIISAYSTTDFTAPVTRRFVAQTMVRALGYQQRNVGVVSDLSSADSDLNTLAYYGYFLPDEKYRLYPGRSVTDEEFAALLSELRLYSSLKGKTIISFGDSIMFGTGNKRNGPAKIVGEKYGMIPVDYSVPGAVMASYPQKSHVADQVRNAIAANQKADLILINGGTNDFKRRLPLGQLTEGYDLSASDEFTYIGGIEQAMQLIRDEWKGVPVIFIRPHNVVYGTEQNEQIYGDAAVITAEKWHAAAIDLYHNSELNAEDRYYRNRYTYFNSDNGDYDSIHPNALGYAAYYLPPISEKIAITVS